MHSSVKPTSSKQPLVELDDSDSSTEEEVIENFSQAVAYHHKNSPVARVREQKVGCGSVHSLTETSSSIYLYLQHQIEIESRHCTTCVL
jgi:hypothetical protein